MEQPKKTMLIDIKWGFHNRVIHPLVKIIADGARWLHDVTLPGEGEEEIEGEVIDLVPLFKSFKAERDEGKIHTLTINTKITAKWRFIDLEEGRIFHWNKAKEGYFETAEEGNWLRTYGPELLARIKMAMKGGN
jgi:hypothetical protein